MSRSRRTVSRGSGRAGAAKKRNRSQRRPRELIFVTRLSAETRVSPLATGVLLDDGQTVLLGQLERVLDELAGPLLVAAAGPVPEHRRVVACGEAEPGPRASPPVHLERGLEVVRRLAEAPELGPQLAEMARGGADRDARDPPEHDVARAERQQQVVEDGSRGTVAEAGAGCGGAADGEQPGAVAGQVRPASGSHRLDPRPGLRRAPELGI